MESEMSQGEDRYRMMTLICVILKESTLYSKTIKQGLGCPVHARKLAMDSGRVKLGQRKDHYDDENWKSLWTRTRC